MRSRAPTTSATVSYSYTEIRARCCAGPLWFERLYAELTRPTCVNACGKLPSSRSLARVVFLGEQAEVVLHAEQSLEELLALVEPTHHHECVDEPERARQERAFVSR